MMTTTTTTTTTTTMMMMIFVQAFASVVFVFRSSFCPGRFRFSLKVPSESLSFVVQVLVKSFSLFVTALAQHSKHIKKKLQHNYQN